MVVRVPRNVPLSTHPMIMSATAVAARAARAVGFSISQSVASASTMDTLSGKVANALATQTELYLQMNIAVNYAIDFG